MFTKKRLLFLGKFLVSGILVCWLVFSINWQEVVGYFKNIKFVYIIYFLIFYCIGIIISARKWQVLAQFKNFSHKLTFYIETYLTGTFINNFLPSFVGGDAYRIYQLGKNENNFKVSSGTVVVDRLSGLLGIMILSIIFSLLNFRLLFEELFLKGFQMNYNLVLQIIFLGLIICLITFSILIFLVKKKKEFVKKKLSFLPKKVSEYLLDFASFRKTYTVLSFMSYSFLFAFIGVALANYMLFLSMNINIGIIDYLSVIFLISIIASVPISIGNVGVKEWAYITLFGLFGVSSGGAVAVVLISRFLQMMVSFSALPLYLKKKEKIINKSG